MLAAQEFLFPSDLSVSGSGIKKCLLVGSCLSGDFVKAFKEHRPGIGFDYLIFNNVAELPDLSPSGGGDYDFQLVQLPARHVLTDRLVKFDSLQSEEVAERFMAEALLALDVMLDAALKYNRKNGLLTFVTNFIVPQIPAYAGLRSKGTARDIAFMLRELNRHLEQRIRQLKNVYLIDVENIASSMGKRYLADDWVGFFGHNSVWCGDWADMEGGRIERVPPITEISPSHLGEFFQSVWAALEHHYRVVRQTDMVKVVIFDLDDTLWRGQIAEHYGDGLEHPIIHGWPLGVSETIFHLRARGVLVAVCSKNDESVVRARWDRAAPLNWVSPEDFVAVEINFKSKAENVSEILKRLCLTDRNAVFVDDNPVEREAVKAAHPRIRLLGSNPFVTRRILLSAAETQVAVVTAEGASRAKMIVDQQVREAERRSLSREEFLMGLRCVVRFEKIVSDSSQSFARCFELLNKTNQFNTTGKRWSGTQILEFFSSGGELFAFHVSDKHTEYGLVGLILLKEQHFEQFVMSCRVLGLEIEASALNYIVNSCRGGRRQGAFTATVYRTDVNVACRDVYEKAGFSKARDGDEGLFQLPSSSTISIAPHLTLVGL